MMEREPKTKIESHSSFLNNKRIQVLFYRVDQLAGIASNNMHVTTISNYYNEIEQVYINVSDVLPENVIASIEKLRQKYAMLVDLMESDVRFRSRKALRVLLQITKAFNHAVVSGLQHLGYFFRVGAVHKKGLQTIKFLDDSIFGGKNATKGIDEGKSSTD